MKDYILTVGLEIHAELATKTKMFCNSRNDTNELRPNTNVCPVCLGYPGTLPVINKEAVRRVLCLGVALGGEIADYTEFDRKNYFYPDIPKGYQISQYKHPLVKGGELIGVKLTRIHLEEDTAKSSHGRGSNDQTLVTNDQYSLLDFNRAGVPLMELVTEPVIKSGEQAMDFAKEFQLLLQYLGVSSANMEKGEMRVEANVSVSKSKVPGTKVEVKNINSFRAVGKTIDFEFSRQVALLEKGGEVVQETRGWDENKEVTFSQRLKESAHDYRYFPDPDLPKLFTRAIPDFAPEVLRRAIPELPSAKRERLLKLGISREHVEIYIRAPEWSELVESVATILKEPTLIQLASNYITSDLKILLPAENLVEVIRMISAGEISSRGAKDILKIMQESGGDLPAGRQGPRAIAAKENLMQESDREVLKKVAEEVLKENPEAPIQFLIGQAMKKTDSRANPVILRELLTNLRV